MPIMDNSMIMRSVMICLSIAWNFLIGHYCYLNILLMIFRGNKRKPAIAIEYFRCNFFLLQYDDSFSVTVSEKDYFVLTSKRKLLKPKEEVTFTIF